MKTNFTMPLDDLELMNDELIFVMGGGNVKGKVSGCGCGCLCGHAGDGCGCGCDCFAGAGCGCGCSGPEEITEPEEPDPIIPDPNT